MTAKKIFAGVRQSGNKESNTSGSAFSEKWSQKLLNNYCFVGCRGERGDVRKMFSYMD
jgi:hypothetical protein